MNKMNKIELTPSQALEILSLSTEPVNVGKLTRQDYLNVQISLETLAAAINYIPTQPQEQPQQEEVKEPQLKLLPDAPKTKKTKPAQV